MKKHFDDLENLDQIARDLLTHVNALRPLYGDDGEPVVRHIALAMRDLLLHAPMNEAELEIWSRFYVAAFGSSEEATDEGVAAARADAMMAHYRARAEYRRRG